MCVCVCVCVRSLTGRFSVIPCSLLSKVDELRAVSEATKPDIICIVENWLDKHIPNNKFFSQTIGYSDWTEIDIVVTSLFM